MNTAVDDDELIRRNPCRIKGAEREASPERSVATPAQIQALVGGHAASMARTGAAGRGDQLAMGRADGADPSRHRSDGPHGAGGPVAVGGPGLRHTGNTWAADSGANLRELMERMGHSSERAALIYLHAASEGHRLIADGIDRKLSGADDEQLGGDDDDGG